MNFCTIF